MVRKQKAYIWVMHEVGKGRVIDEALVSVGQPGKFIYLFSHIYSVLYVLDT